jgi:hypothetical protein
MKNDPLTLRQQAKKLLEEAERIEKEKYARVGKLVITKYVERNFEGFDLEKFKVEVLKEVGK